MARRFLTLALTFAAAPLVAQETVPWRASYFPYAIGNPSTGFMLVGHYDLARQADYEKRFPYDGIVSAEAGYSTNNSRFVSARFRAPGLVTGWRFAAEAGAYRESTFGYFGDGPNGWNESFEPGKPYNDSFFQVSRTRYLARGEVTRKLGRGFSLALGGTLTHARFASRGDSSEFSMDYGLTGVVNGPPPVTGTDAVGRVTLVLDIRDREFLTTKGLLFEGGAYAGTGRAQGASSSGYTGAYLHLRGYVSPREGTVFAARLAARALGLGAPLDARYTLPGWERDVAVLGGAESHRSFVPGRLAGHGLVFGSVEVRHNLLDVGDFGAVTLLAFADGGRAYRQEGFLLSLSGWQVGGGGGVAIRVLRSAPLVLNFAGGPDGFRFSMGNGFAF